MAYYRKYPQELRERALRRVAETQQPVSHVAREMGIHPEALRTWVRADEIERGERPELLRDPDHNDLERLRTENDELRQANAVLTAATAYLAQQLHRTTHPAQPVPPTTTCFSATSKSL
jgi:transposase